MMMNSKRPLYRAVIDRQTGRPAGPPVPVFDEDWPYRQIKDSEVLGRYMDFWKFKDLLNRQALYFSRPDQFVDPFEGRFSEGNSHTSSVSDRAFATAYGINLATEELRRSQEIMRQCVFICCWHRNNKENREMWDSYTSGPDSLLVLTSAKALNRFLPEHIVKSAVKYHPDEFPRSEFDHTALFFYKTSRYFFEREFRLLLPPGNDPIGIDVIGRHVEVPLKKIIHRVIMHPQASPALKTEVRRTLTGSLGHVRLFESTLIW